MREAYCASASATTALVVTAPRREFHQNLIRQSVSTAFFLSASLLGPQSAFAQAQPAAPSSSAGVDGSQTRPDETQDDVNQQTPLTPLPAQSQNEPVAGQKTPLQAMHDRLELKGWNIPFPSYDDSLTRDVGGYRTALSKAGIGFLAWVQPSFADNLLDRPRSNNGKQAYWGQKPSAGQATLALLTFDLGTVGLKGGQFQLGMSSNNSSYEPFIPNALTLYRLAYYQSLFNGQVEFSAGLMGNTPVFVGTYVGGQVQNPFGPNAAIPSELGLSAAAVAQPTAWIKVHPSKSVYNMFGVARSMNRGGVLAELDVNPDSTKFNEKGAKALYIDEFGVKTPAKPYGHATWFRAGVIHNTTRYAIYGTGRTASKTGYYALIDRQLTQSNPGSEKQAYRGLYAGASAMYTSPKTSIVAQYYEARLYGKGLMASRPLDTISLIYTHQTLSKREAAVVDANSDQTGLYAATATNSVTGSYNAHLFRGTYGTLGLQYLDRPSFTFTKKEGNALNLLAGLFFVF
jgi:porin